MAGNPAACYKDSPILAEDVTAAQQYVRWVRQAVRMDLADLLSQMEAEAVGMGRPDPGAVAAVQVQGQRFR